MEKIVVANLKMNLTFNEIEKYMERINDLIDHKNVVICPTSIYVPYFLNNKYQVGVQNISANEMGAYTGEISAKQVNSLGINYAIVGHSERRTYYNETNEIVNSKVILGIKNNLNIILCVGETKEERELEKTEEKIKEQILTALSNVEELDKVVIAYEPIWAIGTNITPTNLEIDSVASYIKKIVKDLYNVDIPVLYGGSVSDKNIDEINKIDSLSGFLVGGASLIPEKLNVIKEVVLK